MKKRKGYIFTNKKHSYRAMMSTILGIISIISLIIVVYFAGKQGGVVEAGFGFTGLFATLFTLVGLVLGIITLRDKIYYRFLPVLGTILNLIGLAGVSLILYAGANL